MNFTGNWFDIAFIAMVLIAALLAFLRGFIRDFASFLNWIIAIFSTYILSPHIAKLFAKSNYSEVVINSAVSSITFIVILIIISIITSKICKSLSEKIPRSVDGSLGFAFGFAKGYFIAALLFSVIVAVYSSGIIINFAENAPQKFKGRVGPEWLTKSQSYMVLEVGANILRPVTNLVMESVYETGLIESEKEKVKNKIKDKIIEKLDEVDKSNSNDGDLEQGYNLKEIQKMNRLIKIIDQEKN